MSSVLGHEHPPIRILVVCTANVCRSPVAAGLLDRHVTATGRTASVTSAGTHAASLRVHPDTLEAALQLGLELADHRPRQLTADRVVADGADLVLTATRDQMRDVVALVPEAWPRTFTLNELVRRGPDVPAVPDLGRWIRAAGDRRRTADLLVPSNEDDLPDPYGLPYPEHLAMVRTVDELTRRIARLLHR